MCWTGPSPFEPQAGLHGQIARERIKFPAEAGVAAAAGMRSLAAKRRAPLDRSSAAVSSRSFATGTCSSFASRYLMNEHRRDEAWRRRRKSAGDGFRRPVVSAGISILAVQDRHHATAANTGCNDFLSRTPDVLRSSSPHVNRQRPVVDPLRQHSAYEPAPTRIATLPLAPRPVGVARAGRQAVTGAEVDAQQVGQLEDDVRLRLEHEEGLVARVASPLALITARAG